MYTPKTPPSQITKITENACAICAFYKRQKNFRPPELQLNPTEQTTHSAPTTKFSFHSQIIEIFTIGQLNRKRNIIINVIIFLVGIKTTNNLL